MPRMTEELKAYQAAAQDHAAATERLQQAAVKLARRVAEDHHVPVRATKPRRAPKVPKVEKKTPEKKPG